MKTLNIEGAPQAIGPYSHATHSNDTLYVSGQLGVDPQSGKLAEGIETQTTQALRNLKTIIDGAGFTLDGIAKVTIYLTSMTDFQTVNTVYEAFMGEHKPARVAIAVYQLPLNGVVEIDAIVCKK